jgi:hypothetical protein
MPNRPSLSVCSFIVRPVPALVIESTAMGMTAELESRIVPAREAVILCAFTSEETIRRRTPERDSLSHRVDLDSDGSIERNSDFMHCIAAASRWNVTRNITFRVGKNV